MFPVRHPAVPFLLLSSILAFLFLAVTFTAQAHDTDDNLAPGRLLVYQVHEGLLLTWQAPTADADTVTAYEVSVLYLDRGKNIIRQLVARLHANSRFWLDRNATEHRLYLYSVTALRADGPNRRSPLKPVSLWPSTPTRIQSANTTLRFAAFKDWYACEFKGNTELRIIFNAGGRWRGLHIVEATVAATDTTPVSTIEITADQAQDALPHIVQYEIDYEVEDAYERIGGDEGLRERIRAARATAGAYGRFATYRATRQAPTVRPTLSPTITASIINCADHFESVPTGK